jgi:protein-disulfide isomerase
LLEKNPETLKIVYKAFPIRSHNMALSAVQAAFAASRQGRFWDFHDKIFADYRNLDPQKINQIAIDLGLEMTRYTGDMTGREVQQQIARDMREAQMAEVTGTPSLYINGFRVQNRSLPALQAMIDRELRKVGKK